MILLAYTPPLGGQDDAWLSRIPIGLGTINAVLRQNGFESEIVRFIDWEEEPAPEQVAHLDPKVLGLSVYTFNRHESFALARTMKEAFPELTVVAGGPHATALAETILEREPAIDAIVLGEGEMTMLELAQMLESGRDLTSVAGLVVRVGDEIIRTAERSPIGDLDALPLASEFYSSEFVNPREELWAFATARGCPENCRFCCSPEFWGRRVRFRSPENVIEEMRRVRDMYGLLHFNIRDDTFGLKREWAVEFCRRIIEEPFYITWECQSRVDCMDEELLLTMRRAGCLAVQYGIETGSPRLLKYLGKRLDIEQALQVAEATRRVGIELSVFLIGAIPGETKDDRDRTLDLITRMGVQSAITSPLAVYSGTALCEAYKAEGWDSDDFWWESDSAAYFPAGERKTAEQLEELASKADEIAEMNAYTEEKLKAQQAVVGECFPIMLDAAMRAAESGDGSVAAACGVRLLEMDPDNYFGFLAISQGELMRENYKIALKAADRFLEELPNNAPMLALRAATLKHLNRYEEALSAWELVLQADPSNEEAISELMKGGLHLFGD